MPKPKVKGCKDEKCAICPITARKVPKKGKKILCNTDTTLNLVTGATGRLGRYLIRELIERGERVRVLKHDKEHPSVFPDGVEVVIGNLMDKATLKRAVEGVDYVYHLAALVSHNAPQQSLLDINYTGTRNLLDACGDAYSLKRFVYTSTISVYGKEIEELPADEETETNPDNTYAKTKLMAEGLVQEYARIPSVILRPAIIYGEGFDEAYMPVLKMLEQGRFTLIGGGNNYVPFIHARDVVNAMILASRADIKEGSTYVIAPQEKFTLMEICEMACKFLKVPVPTKTMPVWIAKLQLKFANAITRMKGKQPKFLEEHIDTLSANRIFDTAKAQSELHFHCCVSLEDGIREMVEYYKSGKVGKSKGGLE